MSFVCLWPSPYKTLIGFTRLDCMTVSKTKHMANKNSKAKSHKIPQLLFQAVLTPNPQPHMSVEAPQSAFVVLRSVHIYWETICVVRTG